MDYRSPLQHLLHNLLPARGGPTASDFVDTQPVDANAAAAQASRRTQPVSPLQLRQAAAWAESALDLAIGSDVTEFPDDAAADLMDEYFAKAEKKAA
jgi:hypothetical protein